MEEESLSDAEIRAGLPCVKEVSETLDGRDKAANPGRIGRPEGVEALKHKGVPDRNGSRVLRGSRTGRWVRGKRAFMRSRRGARRR